jgi:hypothetical protein
MSRSDQRMWDELERWDQKRWEEYIEDSLERPAKKAGRPSGAPVGRRRDLTADQETSGETIIFNELERRRLANEPRLTDQAAIRLLRDQLNVPPSQATPRRLLDACIRPARRRHNRQR